MDANVYQLDEGREIELCPLLTVIEIHPKAVNKRAANKAPINGPTTGIHA